MVVCSTHFFGVVVVVVAWALTLVCEGARERLCSSCATVVKAERRSSMIDAGLTCKTKTGPA